MRKSEEAPDPQIIKTTRLHLSLTQRESADIIHAGIRAWQNWEQGVRSMPYATWQYFLMMTRNRLSSDARLSTGLGFPSDRHPCAECVKTAWRQRQSLEDARQTLAQCLKQHAIDPTLANYTLAAVLADSGRSEPTPDEAAETVKHLMAQGANLLEVGQWFSIWG
ncbi:hypothetical protein JKG47_03605 [Acidithiobacillus sp. MC6.1]|nr:hypothetical protein [Acidithiobacillus sp. MC6.1]